MSFHKGMSKTSQKCIKKKRPARGLAAALAVCMAFILVLTALPEKALAADEDTVIDLEEYAAAQSGASVTFTIKDADGNVVEVEPDSDGTYNITADDYTFSLTVYLPMGIDAGTYVYYMPAGIEISPYVSLSGTFVDSDGLTVATYTIDTTAGTITFVFSHESGWVESNTMEYFTLTRSIVQTGSGSQGGGTDDDDDDDDAAIETAIKKSFTLDPTTMNYEFTVTMQVPKYSNDTAGRVYEIYDESEYYYYNSRGTIRSTQWYQDFSKIEGITVQYYEASSDESISNVGESFDLLSIEEVYALETDGDESSNYEYDIAYYVYPDEDEGGIALINRCTCTDASSCTHSYTFETENGEEITISGWTTEWNQEYNAELTIIYEEDYYSHVLETLYSGEDYNNVSLITSNRGYVYTNMVTLSWGNGGDDYIDASCEIYIPDLIQADCEASSTTGIFTYTFTLNNGYTYTDDSGNTVEAKVDLSQYGSEYGEEYIYICDTLENIAYNPYTLEVYYYPDNASEEDGDETATEENRIYLTLGTDYEVIYSYSYSDDEEGDSLSNITGTDMVIRLKTESLGEYTYYLVYDGTICGDLLNASGEHSSYSVFCLPNEGVYDSNCEMFDIAASIGTGGDGEWIYSASEMAAALESDGSSVTVEEDGTIVYYTGQAQTVNASTPGPGAGASGSGGGSGYDSILLESITLTIVKEDESDPSTRLSGATFGLYSEDGRLITTGTTDENGEITFSIARSQGIVFYTNCAYYLVELEAPDGYLTDSSAIWFYMMYKNAENETIEAEYGGILALSCEEAEVNGLTSYGYAFEITVLNPPIYVLPETGAEFINSKAGVMSSGAVLIALALAAYAVCSRKKKHT